MVFKISKNGKKRKEIKPLTDKQIKKALKRLKKMDPKDLMPGRCGGCDVIM